ncbi:hypothetical protein RHCRD62_100113 [Rhodococcus sp. RD6.2]|nr:hypothetical protein RHCRD62_100113 [Rhodococcus sp. RD6.2]
MVGAGLAAARRHAARASRDEPLPGVGESVRRISAVEPAAAAGAPSGRRQGCVDAALGRAERQGVGPASV